MKRVIEVAQSQIGFKNTDGESKYFSELFPNQRAMPWCLPFIEWVFSQVYGREQSVELLYMLDGKFTYSVPAMVNFVKQSGKWYWKTVEVGWLIFLRMGNEWVNHVELIVEVTDDSIRSIGGNCAGEVKENLYCRNDVRIAGYAKINYPDSK